MKVLYVTLGFLPARSWGGPVQVALQNSLELKRRGYDVTICAVNLYKKHERIRPHSFSAVEEGLRVVYLDVSTVPGWRGTLGPAILSPSSLRRLASEVQQADVVHVNGIRNILSLTASWLAFQQGKPVVLQPHGSVPRYHSSVLIKTAFDNLFLKPWFRRISMFLALHEHESNDIVRAGGKPTNVRIIANALDMSSYHREEYVGRFRNAYQIPADRLLVLFSGRLHPIKGADLLVRAFAQLKEQGEKQMMLALVGPDDGHLEVVSSLIHQFGLQDEVVVTGLLIDDMLKAAHADADIFVLPSRADNFPVTAIEACQAETPMIITNSCAIAPVFAQRTADIVPPSVDALAQALNSLANDPDRRARYRVEARELMRTEFSITKVGETLESVYFAALRGTATEAPHRPVDRQFRKNGAEER